MEFKEIYIIKVLYANITRITEAKQDLFCRLDLEEQKVQTTVKMDTPTKPIWEEIFKLFKSDKYKLKVSVWDYDSFTKSDLIGDGEFDLKPLKFEQKKNISVEIFFKAKKAGVVFMDIEYKKENPLEKPKDKRLREKKTIQKKLMNEKCVFMVNEDYETVIQNFKKIDLDQFLFETNVRAAVLDGLISLGKTKPKNPINFLGNFFINYK